MADGAAVSGLSSTVNSLALVASLSAPSAGRRERRLRHDQCRYVPCRSEEQVALGLGGTVREKGRNGKADQSPGLVHFTGRVPAAHREQPVGIKPIEKALPCLDRVETILREREGAGSRRRPGIDEAHLDDIEGAWCARKPAARLVDLELHPIQCRDRCIVGKVMLQDVDDDRIDLDARHVTQTEEALRQYVPTATDADHGTRLQVRNGIGEVGHVIAQEAPDSRGFHRSGTGQCRRRRRYSALAARWSSPASAARRRTSPAGPFGSD